MTIKQYADSLGITATEEQLEKLKAYLEHKPSLGDTYLFPVKVLGYNGDLDVVVDILDKCRIAISERCFTPDRLVPNYPTPKQEGLTAKFKVGQRVRSLRTGNERIVEAIVLGYTMKGRPSFMVWGEAELEAVEEAK